MILINFSHPLTPEQLESIKQKITEPLERVMMAPTQFDHQQEFLPQLESLMAKIDLSPQEWQTASLLVNPPSLNFITGLVLAEVHGRCGYFPPVVRLRPIKESLPPRFEVAEILNLQMVRDTARTKRL